MRTEVFIGVDISKPRLDVFNLATGEVLEFENTPAGIQAFVKYAKKSKPTLTAFPVTPRKKISHLELSSSFCSRVLISSFPEILSGAEGNAVS